MQHKEDHGNNNGQNPNPFGPAKNPIFQFIAEYGQILSLKMVIYSFHATYIHNFIMNFPLVSRLA